jgi:outer membrane protein assembly factor BamB
MGGRNKMKSFLSIKAVVMSTRPKKSFDAYRAVCLLTLTSLLVLMSTVMPPLCSASTDVEPTGLVDGATPAAQSGEVPYSEATDTEPHQSSDSWPMFRHDLNHTGYSTSQIPDGPSIDWTFQAVGGFESSPVVEYGMVFIGSEDYNVYALNESTSEVVWRFTTGKYVRATPTVVDGKIFIGSLDGRFYALDAYSGGVAWIFDRPARKGDKAYYHSSPAVDETARRVYTGASVINRDLDDEHQEFFCLNMTTGEMIWNVSDPSGASQTSSPAVSEDAVFISLGKSVLSLDKTTGQELWEFPMNAVSHSSPTVANDTVFIQSYYAGTLFALDRHTGSLKWKLDQPKYMGLSNPSQAYHNGVVFVGSWDYNVYAVNAGTGKVLWKYETGSLIGSSLAVADEKIIVPSMDGFLYVIGGSDGSLVWKFDLGWDPYSSPAVTAGRIFVTDRVHPDDTGTLFAFGPPPRSITLDIDPDTLNLNSKGRWITAYITAENASVEDIDTSSLLLNDLITPAWWDIQDDTTLMVKFDRASVEAILPISNSVDIKITGQWKDGEAFEVHDVIRVIDVGGHMESPLMIRSTEDVYGSSGTDFLSVPTVREEKIRSFSIERSSTGFESRHL